MDKAGNMESSYFHITCFFHYFIDTMALANSFMLTVKSLSLPSMRTSKYTETAIGKPRFAMLENNSSKLLPPFK